jgi:diguanylate cyclase (GGDEF)-like protein
MSICHASTTFANLQKFFQILRNSLVNITKMLYSYKYSFRLKTGIGRCQDVELVGNTFFWTFFFMIGFVATIQLVEDLGPELVMRWLRVRVSAALLIAIYVVLILLFIRALRLFGTTFTWTANALRNGALIYISKRLHNQHIFRGMLVAVFLTYIPFWNWNWAYTVGLALVLLLLVPLNDHQDWIKANHYRHGAVLVMISLVYWLFDMWSYHYELGATLGVTVAFIVVISLAHGYDHLLVYRKQEAATLQYDNQHDALTGTRSLSKFVTDFSRLRKLSVAGTMPAVHLVMIDIDHFKRINDTYGHLVGNDVLQTFSRHLDAYLTDATFPSELYRTGGEEFSILIAGGATDEQVQALMDGYLTELRKLTIPTNQATIKLTISVGITSVLTADAEDSDTIGRADSYLYEAKRGGRNRVVASD